MDEMSYPCFPPNQPDQNVPTEVAAWPDFQALESASSAAYIGEFTVKWALIVGVCSNKTGLSGPMTGPAQFFKLRSHSGKCGPESEICKRFTEIERMPGKVVCSLANFIISVFIFR